jgi:hypothetical protein
MFLLTLLLVAGPVVLIAPALYAAMRAERWGQVVGLLGFAAFLISLGQLALRAFT